ncbi:MAG: right-handed parallel beta-helix repeat-containing protein [Phycisphaeraceae bacterium]|nr:right-handed parallel beta-helix repeat-containing protein [Phycisphaeraceae bacterium]
MSSQSLVIVPIDQSFEVLDRWSRASRYQSPQADAALQWAIDHLDDKGGHILLAPGSYPCRQPVRLRSGVRFEGAGRATRLIVGSDKPLAAGIHLSSLDLAQVANLSICKQAQTHVACGLLLEDCGQCVLQDVHSAGFDDYGIHLTKKTFLCELRHCSLADNRVANLCLSHMGDKARVGDFVPNMITGCVTLGGGIGIECRDHVTVMNFNNCTVYKPCSHAYFFHETCNSILLTGCRSFQVEGHAVYIRKSHEINISSNVFCWQRDHGIVLEDVNWGVITGNEIIDSGVRAHDKQPRHGIVMKTGVKGVEIVGNTIFNWGDQPPMDCGVTEDQSCMENLVCGNTINYFTHEAVHSEGIGTLAKDNVTRQQPSYRNSDKPPFPDFDRKLLYEYLRR